MDRLGFLFIGLALGIVGYEYWVATLFLIIGLTFIIIQVWKNEKSEVQDGKKKKEKV